MKKRAISLLVCLSLVLALAPALSQPAAASTNGHTQAEAVAWVKSQIGKYLDYDGAYGAQCVDLIKYYYAYLGNGKYGTGNATNYQSNALPSGWKRVKSDPQPGDVIVWGGGTKGSAGWTVSEYGHVGIVIAVNGDKLTTVEQNINGSPCKQTTRSAAYATCFIRPDFTSERILTINHNVNGGTLDSTEYKVSAAGIVQKDGKDVTTKWAYGTGSDKYGLYNASTFGLSREGYAFMGWSLSKDGSTTIFDQDDTTLKAENIYSKVKDGSASVTLYAIWQPADTAVYVISPKCAPDSCLDVQSSGKFNGANVHIWEYASLKNQQWAIVPVGDGWYKLMPQHSPKALDVAGQGTVSGTNVQQYIYTEQHDAQKWQLEPAGDGYYYIVPKGNTGLCLDVSDAGSENGTNVQVWERNETDAQKWKITLIGGTPGANDPLALTASFDTGGGYVSVPSVTVHYNAPYGELPTPTRTGYEFQGWYTSRTGGSKVTAASTVTIANHHVLYARWTEEASQTKSPLPFDDVRTYPAGTFSDIEGKWYVDNVKSVYRLGLMNGTGAGRFAPGNNVTAAEAVTMAARLHNTYYENGEEFKPFDGGKWYDPYVNYVKKHDMLAENYEYGRPVTREEFAHILAAAFPEEALEAKRTGASAFADRAQIVYRADVELLYMAGVINGVEKDGQLYFKPGEPITRAEAAAIITRMAKPELRG